MYSGDGPFVFISYSHEDLQRIKPLVAELRPPASDWYDKGIPGGAEWDSTIEDRVRRSAVLLLFRERGGGSVEVREA